MEKKRNKDFNKTISFIQFNSILAQFSFFFVSWWDYSDIFCGALLILTRQVIRKWWEPQKAWNLSFLFFGLEAEDIGLFNFKEFLAFSDRPKLRIFRASPKHSLQYFISSS